MGSQDSRPRLVLLAAVAKGRVIGIDNTLPWHLPEDLQRFKAITTGHAVVMGRKTFESIVARLGKPLPNRENIVITRDPRFCPSGVRVIHSLDELSGMPHDKIFVIGGAQVYAAALADANEIDMTEIDLNTPGDAFFPEIDDRLWVAQAGPWRQSEASGLAYRFVTFRRGTSS